MTPEAVLALAPDESSAKAARGLLGAGQWPLLGASEQAIWGECQGSGSKPYQAQIDRAGPAFRCSCPSRKFPCKHGLALLLLQVQQPERFQVGEPPAWVADWLQSRQQRASKQIEKVEQAQAAAPADPQAAERREARRWQRLRDGADELQRWLADQLAQGLAASAGQPEALRAWRSQAARLVDAQAPGLAARLLAAADRLQAGPAEVEAVLLQLGLLQLLLDALREHERLPPAQQALLHTVIGWPLERSDWLAATPAEPESWYVLGVALQDREAGLQERRCWLQSLRDGRRALLLEHRHGSAGGFEQAWLPGSRVQALLHAHPAAGSARYLCSQQLAPPEPAVPPAALLDDEWQRVAEGLALNPWQSQHPLLLPAAVPLADDHLWTGAQRLPLRLAEAERWNLLALSGGHPLCLSAEWDGEALRPLAAWQQGELRWQA